MKPDILIHTESDGDFLMHFGIPGQKWGTRRYQNSDGSLTEEGKAHYNSGYSQQQRLADRQYYGQGGVERINKSMNEGYGIKAARSIEAKRINNTRSRAREMGTAGSAIGSIGGAAAGAAAGALATKYILNRFGVDSAIANTAAVTAAASIGSAGLSYGNQLGRYLGTSLGMITGGYSSDKYR